MSKSSAQPLQPNAGERGLASSAPGYAAVTIRTSWREFSTWWETAHLADHFDLTVAREVVGQLGSWPEQRTMADLIAEACAGGEISAELAGNAAAPADATYADITCAFQATHAAIMDWLHRPDWLDSALAPASTPLGRLPLLTALHGTVHQLAVAQLALVANPTDAHPELLAAGVLATCDTMGAFAARSAVRGSLALATPTSMIATWASHGSWYTTNATELPPGYRGPVVSASAAVLLGITSGQADVPALYRSGEIRVDDLAGLLNLAPALAGVPGMPNLGAITTATKWVASTGQLLSRLSSLGRRSKN